MAYRRTDDSGHNTCVAIPLKPSSDCSPRAVFLFPTFVSVAKRLQSRGKNVQRNNSSGITTFNRGFGHAIDHAGFFTLRNGHAAGLLHGSKSFSAVVAHSSH